MTVLLEASSLTKHFHSGASLFRRGHIVHALSNVSFTLERGQTLAIVGESGCGKSTLARCLAGLTPPTGGRFKLQGDDAHAMLNSEPFRFHQAVQIVFQDPYTSLNPRRTVLAAISDALRLHRICARADRPEKASELLDQVGLSAEHLQRFPHELSGGQRQRVAIARSLAVRPQILICDEPVSALDVSIQAQIINLLKMLQASMGIAYVFISHNLSLVRHISDRIAVMYLGQIVEIGDTQILNKMFLHPYSRALFDATPKIGSATRARRVLTGEVPSPLNPPSGCRFRTRCPLAAARCAEVEPELRTVRDRDVRCHFAEEMASLVA